MMLIKKIEFIESYIKTDESGSYQWNDNHGELIRCKDCRYWDRPPYGYATGLCKINGGISQKPEDWFCADGEKKEKI